MSYGGEISDRALWDKEWYKKQFVYPNGKKLTLTFYEGRPNHLGRCYGLMLTPRHNPNATHWCTGDNRHRLFYTREERDLFMEHMLECIEANKYDCKVQDLEEIKCQK